MRALISLSALAVLATLALPGCKHADSTKTAHSTPKVETAAPKAGVAIAKEPGDKGAADKGAADKAGKADKPKGPSLPKGVDTKGLDPAEVKILASILEDQFDPCGKPRSFKAAVAAGDCALATRLVRFISHKLQQGYGKRKIVALLLREIERLNTVVSIDTDGAPRLGAENAKVKVVIFSDFQCPFCRRAAKPLKALHAHYSKLGVAVFYKHYPLKQAHEYAEGAARAAWAAQQQGKFWPMHDVLFKNNHALKWEDVTGYAAKLGLDMKRFEADVKGDASKKAVDRDYNQGREAQVDGTPTFFINGRRAETLEQLQDGIREQLGLAGVKELPKPLDLADADPKPEGAAGDAKAAAAPAH